MFNSFILTNHLPKFTSVIKFLKNDNLIYFSKKINTPYWSIAYALIILIYE